MKAGITITIFTCAILFYTGCSNTIFYPKKSKSEEEKDCIIAAAAIALEEKRVIAANGGQRCIYKTSTSYDNVFCYARTFKLCT